MPLTVFTTLCVIFFMPLRPVEGSWVKKVKAIDFIGVFLTLAGSTLIVVCCKSLAELPLYWMSG